MALERFDRLIASPSTRTQCLWYIEASCRVPQALMEHLKQELHRMEEAGTIATMTKPSDWVSPLVLVKKKNGSLRVCMDPRRMGERLKCEHFEMPRREDIEAKLAIATVFRSLIHKQVFIKSHLQPKFRGFAHFTPPYGDTDFWDCHLDGHVHPKCSSVRGVKFSMDCREPGCTLMTYWFGALRDKSMESDCNALCRLCTGPVWRST